MREKDVQRQILDYLSLKRVWHRRLNTGAARYPGNGGRDRFVRFGAPGLPDILARPNGAVVWIECKSDVGRLSKEQAGWKEDAERWGDTYILARKVEDVMALFEKPNA